MWIALIIGWLLIGLLARCMVKYWWVNYFGNTRGLPTSFLVLTGLSYLIGAVCFITDENNKTSWDGKKFNRWGLKL